ncbi:MAG: hypothetical protein JF616_13090 [Fibrobacteres bacterium]|nr:hypothetical protein [Fibrobacterota bacterium]
MRTTAILTVRLAAAALGLSLTAAAHELKDVSLMASGGKAQLKLSFSAGAGESEFPLYFQKGDAARGTLTLSFLETGTAYPLGRHPLDANAPELEDITLKKITSPSGKNFLGIEFKLRDPGSAILADGEAEVQTAPKGILKIQLGKSTLPKYEWSLAKALQAGDAYLSAKAAPPPKVKSKTAKAEAAAAAAAERETAEAFSAPVPAEPSAPSGPGDSSAARDAQPAAASAKPVAPARKARLVEIQSRVAAEQEDLLMLFDAPVAVNPVPTRDPKDTAWTEISIENAVSGLPRKEYTLPGNGVFRQIKAALKGGKLVVRVKLAEGASVSVTPQENGLTLSAPGKGGSASASAWSSKHPGVPDAGPAKAETAKTEAKPDGKAESKTDTKVEANAKAVPKTEMAGKTEASAPKTEEAPDPVTSAHADGMALDKSHGAGAGVGAGKAKGSLSSSRVFGLAAGGKTLVLLKDSASLKSDPGAQGKVIRKIPIGEKVVRLDTKWGKVRVVAGQDTGWLRASEAVYDDELTPAQDKAIQGKLASNRARIEAAQAKLAAAQAKEAEKAAKAEAARLAKEEAKRKAEEATAKAAAEAQRKLAEKQAALDAKRQAAAAAAAAKANPPVGIQEAGAAPNRVGQAQPGGGPNPGAAPGAGAKAPAQGAPKLGLADNPELANKLAQEKQAAEEEKKRIEPEENRVTYNSYGRRDPFIPVEQGAADNGIDIDQMKVVGIIWQASQPMAVLEHSHEAGVSFTVKEGDPVHNGRVARISHDAVTFDISEYGISRSYSLRLVSNAKEGAKK